MKAMNVNGCVKGYANSRFEIEGLLATMISQSAEESEDEETLSNDLSIEDSHVFLIISDFKDFTNKAESREKGIVEQMIRGEIAANIHVIMGGLVSDLNACWDGPGKVMKDTGNGLLFSEPNDQSVFNLRLPYTMTSKLLKADEAYWIQRGDALKIKVTRG